jgi:heme-degrading monooxygenase HmoA
MFARLVTVQIQQGKMDEATNIYGDSVVPAAQQQKGFKSGFLFSDPSTGKGVSITLWETEDDMKASETSGYLQEQIAKFAAVLAAPPTTEHYEVAIQT